jgi:large subunit ribosomal protein L22
MKRWRPRAQGRASRINKRTSHITLVVQPRTQNPGTTGTAKAAKASGSTTSNKKGRNA